jgi:hypothetical protein
VDSIFALLRAVNIILSMKETTRSLKIFFGVAGSIGALELTTAYATVVAIFLAVSGEPTLAGMVPDLVIDGLLSLFASILGGLFLYIAVRIDYLLERHSGFIVHILLAAIGIHSMQFLLSIIYIVTLNSDLPTSLFLGFMMKIFILVYLIMNVKRLARGMAHL